jgi:hypothetical protein
VTARRVEEAAERLKELRTDEWSELGLAGVAFGLALAAGTVHRPLAVPLLVGAVALTALGIRALLRRWELFDDLLRDQDAYSISEVARHAARAASMKNRRQLASTLREELALAPGHRLRDRVVAVSTELHELAAELEDEALVLEPWCAVRCEQLLTCVDGSPLFDELLPAEDLLARINQIRAGFRRVL